MALAIDFVAMAMDGAYDVGIICSADSDLRPALELVLSRFGAKVQVATAFWRSPTCSRRLTLPREQRVRCHALDEKAFLQVVDLTDYASR